jgi:hypothetical protein
MKTQYVQGDVIFIPLDEYSDASLAVHDPAYKHKCSKQAGNVVATGEKTGHKHLLFGGFIYTMVYDGLRCAFVEKDGGTVTHDEHGTLKLPPGAYEIRQQKFHDYKAAFLKEKAERKVED